MGEPGTDKLAIERAPVVENHSATVRPYSRYRALGSHVLAEIYLARKALRLRPERLARVRAIYPMSRIFTSPPSCRTRIVSLSLTRTTRSVYSLLGRSRSGDRLSFAKDEVGAS